MNFTPVIRFSCLFLIVALIGQTASAQRSFGSRNSLTSLAATESVQKHLGISGETASRLNSINDEYRVLADKELKALGIDSSAIRDLPAAERVVETRKATEQTASANRKLAAAFLPKLQELLTP